MPSELSIAGSPALHLFIATHASLLSHLHAQAKAARWGLSPQEFSSSLYRSAERYFETRSAPAVGREDAVSSTSADTVAIYLRALHLEDLAMACAMRLGSEPAWEAFVAGYRPVLYAAARAIVTSAGEARARELADSIYADLYMGKNPAAKGVDKKGDPRGTDVGLRRSLLDYFHGRSKLSTWLCALLAQRHVDDLRAGRRTESLDDARLEDVAAARRLSPSRVVLRGGPASSGSPDPDRARLLPPLRRAVTHALAELPSTDRMLLGLYYVEGLTLAHIARLRDIHEATASRYLERIRKELREAVEHELASGQPPQNGKGGFPALSPAEIRLCFEYAVEDWSFDLRDTDLRDTLAGEDSRHARGSMGSDQI